MMQFRLIAKYAQNVDGNMQKMQKPFIIKSETEMGVHEKFAKYADEHRLTNVLIKQVTMINYDSIDIKDDYNMIYQAKVGSTTLDEAAGKEVNVNFPVLVGCDSVKEAIAMIEARYDDAKVRSIGETGILEVIE